MSCKRFIRIQYKAVDYGARDCLEWSPPLQGGYQMGSMPMCSTKKLIGMGFMCLSPPIRKETLYAIGSVQKFLANKQ